jgi:hypothetical protein
LLPRERSPEESTGVPGAAPNEFVSAPDGNETDDERLLGSDMAYGAFNEERDAWNSSDTYTTSKR